MGASEGSTKVCWESLQGNSVGAGDHQGVIVAASHGRIGNLELFEIKSELNNLKLIEISCYFTDLKLTTKIGFR